MCWSLRVYGTVLHNLVVRFFHNFGHNRCVNHKCPDCWRGCCTTEIPDRSNTAAGVGFENSDERYRNFEHDYVIVDEADAGYLIIEQTTVEAEPYYRTIDREAAEELLIYRTDGSCLVRPYKEEHKSVKYVVSIYAQRQFFHLYVRRIDGKELYGIGQKKSYEKLFPTPNQIIEFYRDNALLCTNKNTSISLYLKPLTV